MSYQHCTQTSRPDRKRCFLALLPVFLLFSVTCASAADAENSQCHAFYGPFSSVVVLPPTCSSPVGLCTNGILTGEFPATYDFTALTQSTDANDPNVVTLTGTSVVTTSNGVIYTDDVSVINFMTGEFVTKALVHRSNLRQAKNGGFIAAGNLNFATGQASGNYSAVLCSGD